MLDKATPKAISSSVIWHKMEAHSELSQTSKKDFFVKIVDS